MENKLLNENEVDQAQGGLLLATGKPSLDAGGGSSGSVAKECEEAAIGFSNEAVLGNEAGLGYNQQELAHGQTQEQQFGTNHYRNK